MIQSTSVPKRPSDVVREALAHYLGPFTSRNAVQLMARQALSTEADRLTIEQIPALLEALGPTLRTLLGRDGTENVFAQIRKELGLEKPGGDMRT